MTATATPLLETVLAAPRAHKEAILRALQIDLDSAPIQYVFTAEEVREIQRRIDTPEDSADLREFIDEI